MTARRYVKGLLENNWEPDVDGRDYTVPEPRIDIEEEKDNIRLRTKDHINIVDGGNENYTPLSVGYQEKTVEVFLDIVIRTTQHRDPNGRTRLNGFRDPDTLDSESYGGLKGEVERIFDVVRKGDQEFDIIQAATWRDEVGLAPRNQLRGVWAVKLDERARRIDPPVP